MIEVQRRQRTQPALMKAGARGPFVGIVTRRSFNSLVAAHPRSLELLECVTEHDSLRAAAIELGLHHSTLQNRIEYSRRLGYELRTSRGRMRLSLALAHLKLASNRFE